MGSGVLALAGLRGWVGWGLCCRLGAILSGLQPEPCEEIPAPLHVGWLTHGAWGRCRPQEPCPIWLHR